MMAPLTLDTTGVIFFCAIKNENEIHYYMDDPLYICIAISDFPVARKFSCEDRKNKTVTTNTIRVELASLLRVKWP
jgi:hypothetical protein